MVDMLGKTNIFQNIGEKTRPGSRNLQKSSKQCMLNLSQIFLGGMILEVNLVFWFKGMDWTKISSIDKIWGREIVIGAM